MSALLGCVNEPERLNQRAADLERAADLALISGRITEGCRLIEKSRELALEAVRLERETQI